jgi:hypothetical protein
MTNTMTILVDATLAMSDEKASFQVQDQIHSAIRKSESPARPPGPRGS